MALILNPMIFYGVACACFAALTAYFVIVAPRGISIIEQTYYLTIPHRMAMGDRLLIDEWHLSQFSAILQYPLYKIAYAVAGNEGIALVFRYLYIAVRLVVSLFMFRRLREYKYTGLVCSLMYCRYTPIETFALSYNTMSLMACTVVFLLLFTGKKEKSAALFSAGVFTACAVLSEPAMAIIYFAWAIAVLAVFIRRKKAGQQRETDKYSLLSVRSFVLVTSGVVLCAVAFFIFMLSRGTLADYIRSVPNLFTDSEYSFGGNGGQNIIDFKFITSFFGIGWFFYAAGAVLIIAAIADKKRMERRRVYVAVAAGLLLCEVVFIYLKVCLDFRSFQINYDFRGPVQTYVLRHIPFFLFGAPCYVLLKDKASAKNLLLLYLSGFVYSFCLDISTDAYDMVCLMGGVFSAAAVTGIAYKLFLEIRSEQPVEYPGKDRLRRCVCALLVCACASAPVFEAVSMKYEPGFLTGIDSNTASLESRNETYRFTTLEKGPLKGVLTTRVVADRYSKTLDDLDVLKAGGGNVYICGLFSWMYLYLDMPYATYSTWFVEDDFDTRQVDYWIDHPDRNPDYIYIPKFDAYNFTYLAEGFVNKKVKKLRSFFDCSVTETEQGFIVSVNGSKLNAR